MFEYKLHKFPTTFVVTLRHYGPYETAGETWGKLSAIVLHKGITGPKVRALGITYDDPTVTPPENIRYDACFAIDEKRFAQLSQDRTPFGDVRLDILHGRATAVAIHKGSYATIKNTYTNLLRSEAFGSPRVQRSPGPFLEEYENNPLLTPETELVTQVHAPIDS